MIYFKNFFKYDELKMEKVLFMFDNAPIIFVCKDKKEDRFLCQCIDMIVGYSWMITKIPYDLLISMIQNEISVLEAFKKSENPIVIAEQLKNGKMEYHTVDFNEISEEDLPDAEEKLDNPYLEDYIQCLKEEKAKKERDARISKYFETTQICFLKEKYTTEDCIDIKSCFIYFENNTSKIVNFDKNFKSKTKKKELYMPSFCISKNSIRSSSINFSLDTCMNKTIRV